MENHLIIMKTQIGELAELAGRNMEKCPWIKNQTSGMHLRKLFLEMEELNDAYKKDDWQGTREELGDVLWDVLVLAYILEKEGKINSKQMITDMRNKIFWRKPWLNSDEEITLDEAKRIWMERKKQEKESLDNTL